MLHERKLLINENYSQNIIKDSNTMTTTNLENIEILHKI